jgi:hypothetical protein
MYAMIFELQADIWLLSMDLHDAALLATQYCKLVKRKNKPVALLYSILTCPL